MTPVAHTKVAERDTTRSSLFAETAITGIVLVLSTIMAEYLLASYASLIAVAAFFVALVLKRGGFFVKYFAFVFAIGANILGCAIIETQEISLPELDTFSSFAGSLPLLILSRWVFVVVLLVCDCRWGELALPKEGLTGAATRQKWVTLASQVILACAILLFLQVVPKPSFFLGLNSFDYARSYGLAGLWQTVANVLSYAIIIPAMAIRQGDKRLGAAAVGVYVLYLLWTGNKFGNFFNVACVLFLVFYDRIVARGARFLRQAAVLCLACILALVGFSLVAFSFTSSKDPVGYLFSRTAQQGQLWWKTYDWYGDDSHLEELEYEWDALIERREGAGNNVGHRNGIYGVMYSTAPGYLIDEKLRSGSQYTEGGYAAALYYFGMAGPLGFSCIMGAIVSLLTNGLLRSIASDRLVVATVCMRLLAISMTALSMFLFIGYFDELSLLSYVFLFVVGLFRAGNRAYIRARSAGLKAVSDVN